MKEKPFSRGSWHYNPGNLYPVEATEFAGRHQRFAPANLSMNQVPQSDVMIRERVILGERRVAPQGPAHTGKEGTDAGVPPARVGLGES